MTHDDPAGPAQLSARSYQMQRLQHVAGHLLGPPSNCTASSATSAGELYPRVVTALSNYFDGAHNRRVEQTRSVWHEQVASLKGLDPDGNLSVREPDSYFELIDSGAAQSSDPTILAADRIVSIEFTSDRTALAKVEVADTGGGDGPATLYTDFLSLVDIEGRGWTIVSKIWTPRPLGTLSYAEPDLGGTHGAIAAQLQHYFDGQRPGAGSSATMKKVFHPTALLRGPVMACDAADHPMTPGQLRVLTAQQFFDMLDLPDFPKWADKGLNKILRIDKSGPRTACATVQIQGSSTLLYTDHLSMLKIGPAETAKWMIVHKTFVPSEIP